jgi:ferritin-like metal-binding protein YciE
MSEPLLPKDVQFEDEHLTKIFLEHLNGIYFGKLHLLDFLKEAEEIAALQQLKLAIDECRQDTKSQLVHMDELYQSLGKSPSKTTALGIKAMTLEAYLTVIRSGKTPTERDVFILFYLQIIEGIEITYFKVLKNLAKAVGFDSHYINQPFDMAVENRLLFESIYKEYIN